MISGRNISLKTRPGAALLLTDAVQSFIVKSPRRWGYLSSIFCVFLAIARMRERVHVKKAAGCVCARFVCHISACLRLMQMGRGLGGTAPWETAGANPACWTGEERSTFQWSTPTPLSSHTHTQTNTWAHAHTWTACSRPMCTFKQTSRRKHKAGHTQVLSLSLAHTHTHWTPVSFRRIQTDMN